MSAWNASRRHRVLCPLKFLRPDSPLAICPNNTSIHSDLENEMRYALLWLLGIPIPVLIILYFLFR